MKILFTAMLLWLSCFPTLGRASTIFYAADTTTDFKNPERGWYVAFYYFGHNGSGNNLLSLAKFQSAVSGANNYSNDSNITMAQRVYVLSGYRTIALDANVLADITADLNAARFMGIKLILRFDYNNGPIGQPDASQAQILSHISQLAPILQANDDVIAYMEAGFIGTWGEWHHSTNGLTDANDTNATPGMSFVLTGLLAALPADRMVAVRYPGYTLQMFGVNTPISAAKAFDGSNYSRCGTHDDCFEVDSGDGGTYDKGTALGWTETQFKNFLASQNYSVHEGGETCGSSAYSGCANSLNDLKNEHWSALHCQYEQSVIQGWISGGCISAINLGLGYRYRLVSSTAPASVTQGGTLSLTLQVANDGFANCYNPRGFEVILRPAGQAGAPGTALFVTPSAAGGTDARFWQPGSLTYTAALNLALPAGLAPGNYDLLLNLPDPKPALHGTPAFSIQLANTPAVWEAATGYNNLNQTIQIFCPGCTPTPTPSPAPPAGTAVPEDGAGTITQIVPLPNPNPATLEVFLSGGADRLDCRIYANSLLSVAQADLPGPFSAGWNKIPLPPGFFSILSNGFYYLSLDPIRQGRSGGTRRIVKIYLVR